MTIKEITNQTEWDKFQTGQPQAQFLQSWAWGEFQKSLGRESRRLGFFDGDKLTVATQLFLYPLPLGLRYFYGPRVDLSNQAVIQLFVEYILKESKKIGGIMMARVEPVRSVAWPPISHPADCRQPAVSLLLDLSPSLEELLAKMHEKTRYNIRLAQKKGLTASVAGEWREFWQLLKDTAERDKIKIHSANYYKQMLARLNDDYLKSWLITVNHGGKVLAGGIFIGYGDTFTYLHGASSSESRELMAPYLLQWTAISQAKQLGYKFYDFWGVNPADGKNPAYRPAWQGITRFKIGFGGEIVTYGAGREWPLRELWYTPLEVFRHALAWLRKKHS